MNVFTFRGSRVLIILIGVLSLYTFYRFGIDQIRPPGLIPNDYINFHRASERLNARTFLYYADEASPFKYSPTFVFFFANTLGRLSPPTAWMVWCAASIALFMSALYFFLELALRDSRMKPVPFAALFIICTIFGWHGYIEHFSYGQTDFLMFGAFLWAALLSLRKEWPAQAGTIALLGLILITKPQCAILLSYFFVTRRWRLLAAVAATTAFLLLLPGFFTGFSWLFDMFPYWKVALEQQKVPFLTGNLNQSLAASIARLSGNRDLVKPLTTLAIATAGALMLFVTRKWPKARIAPKKFQTRLIAGTLALYCVVSPLSWRWLTFIWIPLGVIAANDAIERRSRPGVFLLSAFAVVGVLTQTSVAHALGIHEVDNLSWAGLYCLGNLLLLLASVKYEAHQSKD